LVVGLEHNTDKITTHSQLGGTNRKGNGRTPLASTLLFSKNKNFTSVAANQETRISTTILQAG